MKVKALLAAFLLGVGLYFVPASGRGEVPKRVHEQKVTGIDFFLLDARVNYMMRNPTNFLYILVRYDPDGGFGEVFPQGVDTKGKVCVKLRDTRDVFSYKSGIALLDQFKKELKIIYSYIEPVATDMDTDIVAKLVSREAIPLAYFYQGEYHLWER